MTEQISHKKSLRVNRLTKDRELLLIHYEGKDAEADTQTDTQRESTALPAPPLSQPNTATGPSFKELIQTHNRLLGQEQDTNNSIKSTIYDNYYDLIRVNTTLQEFTSGEGQCVGLWNRLQANLTS